MNNTFLVLYFCVSLNSISPSFFSAMFLSYPDLVFCAQFPKNCFQLFGLLCSDQHFFPIFKQQLQTILSPHIECPAVTDGVAHTPAAILQDGIVGSYIGCFYLAPGPDLCLP